MPSPRAKIVAPPRAPRLRRSSRGLSTSSRSIQRTSFQRPLAKVVPDQLRVSVSNFAGSDYVTGGNLLSTNPQGQTVLETTQTVAPTFVNAQLRLEIKL